jgi:hypothetical protein
LSKLQDWIESKTFEYKQIIKSKSCGTQSLIEISYNHKDNELICEKILWKSNCNFNNRFFTNKDNIIRTIDNFINNEIVIIIGMNFLTPLLISIFNPFENYY